MHWPAQKPSTEPDNPKSWPDLIVLFRRADRDRISSTRPVATFRHCGNYGK